MLQLIRVVSQICFMVYEAYVFHGYHLLYRFLVKSKVIDLQIHIVFSLFCINAIHYFFCYNINKITVSPSM